MIMAGGSEDAGVKERTGDPYYATNPRGVEILVEKS
jgi:hypothetical protein